jgi:nitrite reductase/ring-hydroxylating ferredoxin subunit
VSRFPFSPHPSGWYVLARSDELGRGEVRSWRFLGREVVGFRGQNGVAALVDAHCPHMGAHLGRGGDVVGDLLRCPFHGFQFDAAGACVAGYPGKAPPKAAKAGCWTLREHSGFLLAWFDEGGAQPTWEVPPVDGAGWTPLVTHCWDLRTHPQETTENSVDIGHFAVVHKYTDVEQRGDLRVDGPYLNTKYAMSRDAGLFGAPGMRFRAEFDVHVHGLGYSFVEARVPSLAVEYRYWVLPAPIAGERTRLMVGMTARLGPDRAAAPPWLRWLPEAIALPLLAKPAWRGFLHDVSQDLEIWENKAYVHPPALAAGDGPVGRYRAWAKQFYPTATGSEAARPQTRD